MVKTVQIGKSEIGPEKFACEHGYCLSEFGAKTCPHGDASTIPLFGCVVCHGEIETNGQTGVYALSEEFSACAKMVQELAGQQEGVMKNLGDAIAYLVKKEPRIQGEQVLVQTVLAAMIEGIEAIEANANERSNNFSRS